MRLIKKEKNPNGSYDNNFSDYIKEIPEGWAQIPDDMELPETFPFVTVKINKNNIVTSMKAATVPESDPIDTHMIEQLELKNQLYLEDYKIIKCFEAFMVGEELPYDIYELHNKRQQMREQID